MAKHKKTENSVPEEAHYKETIRKLLEENAELRDALKVAHYVTIPQFLKVAHYVTIPQFVEEYSRALLAYMESQFSYRKGSNEIYHPEDLYSTAIGFAEAVWHMHSEVDIRNRGKGIGF